MLSMLGGGCSHMRVGRFIRIDYIFRRIWPHDMEICPLEKALVWIRSHQSMLCIKSFEQIHKIMQL